MKLIRFLGSVLVLFAISSGMTALCSFAKDEKFRDAAGTFQAVRQMLLKDYYDDGLTEEDLYRAATQGMLEHLGDGRWNKLYSPAEYASLQSELNGEIVGVGLEVKLDAESGLADVLGVLSGTPAEKAGLLAGDKILSVDGKRYKGKSLPELVGNLRGQAGTAVVLSVLRGENIKSIKVHRQSIMWAAVEDTVLPNDIGVIVIRSFQANTEKQLRDALERMKSRNIRGILLDLRNNSGGRLDAVTQCAGFFLPKGKAIVTVIKRGGAQNKIESKTEVPLISVPVAVIVNGSTTSGAEIMTAALRSGVKAMIVGEKTFGKWNVQGLKELPNRFALKYTQGVFLSPDGESFQGKGMEPDIVVKMEGGDLEKLRKTQEVQKRLAADVQLRAAYSVIKLKM